MGKIILFCFLLGLTVIAAPKVRADADGDVDRAAQKLDDQEKQDKADEQAEYDRQHPKEYDGTPSMGAFLAIVLVVGGGFVFIRFLWNLPEPPKR